MANEFVERPINVVKRNSIYRSYDKVFDFFDKLLLSELRLINCDAFIAGGALREYFLNKKITTDVDVYFKNDAELNKAKEWFLNPEYCPIETIINRSPEDKRNEIARFVYNRPIGKLINESKAAYKIEYNGLKIDLVKKIRGSATAAIQSFDFTVASIAIDHENLYFDSSYFIDLVNRDLIIKSYHHPLSTLYRLQKYIKMGFTISTENLFTLAKEIKGTPIAEINPVEFMLDQFENPNGVVRVDAPIRRKSQVDAMKVEKNSMYGAFGTNAFGTNGNARNYVVESQQRYDDMVAIEDFEVAEVAEPPQPVVRRAVEAVQNFFGDILHPETKDEEGDPGY